jgi:hypothetical protein
MKIRHAVLFALLAVSLYSQNMLAADGEKPKVEAKETLVYVTKAGEKYHCKDCRTIADKAAVATSLVEAKKKLQACAVCKPDSIVLVSEKGEKYHTKECKVAGENAKEVELAAAQTQGYEACKVCHPEVKKEEKKEEPKEGEKPVMKKKKEGS